MRTICRPFRAASFPQATRFSLFASACLAAALGGGARPAAEAALERTAAVFDGPPAAYEEPLAPAGAAGAGVLRWLSVEERAGQPRRGALVRAPVFFAAGECPDLRDLAVVPADGGGPAAMSVSWQADDIRRGPDGGISRVHLWFAVDLRAGEKRRFLLVRRNSGPAAAPAPAMAAATADGGVRLAMPAGAVIFGPDGALRALPGPAGGWSFGADGAWPRAVLTYAGTKTTPAAEVVLDRTAAARTAQWDEGPLFAKVRLRLAAADGAALEEVWRIPRAGGELAVSSALFPGARTGEFVRENRLFEGRLAAPAAPAVTVVPAGVRSALRAEHAYAVDALVDRPGAAALLAIPLVIGGPNGRWEKGPAGALTLQGQRGVQRGDEGEKQTLHAYWTEVGLVPAAGVAPAQLWAAYRAHVQPLVAVVDEPGVTPADLHAALQAVVREMKPIGWRQEAGRAAVLGDTAALARLFRHAPAPAEADEAYLLRGATRARERMTAGGHVLRQDEKGRAYGALDPYDLTYNQSSAAALAVLGHAPPAVAATDLAMARAVRAAGARVDGAGFPYLDCFNRAFNMQLGAVLFGLTAGAPAGDAGLVRFYRDLATAPPELAVFGRGQRPYSGAPATAPEQTDFLYQAICDFWLRAAELLGGEDLGLHPLAYGRYTDCLDVMADQYNGVAARDAPGAPGLARANFFRGQAHTHRWLGWSAAPFLRPLEDPAEDGRVGLTEAVRYARSQRGRWKNWPDLTFYVLADLLVREALPRAVRPALPPLPSGLAVRPRPGGGVSLTWSAVPGAAGYRVYRAPSSGGPWRWLDSPYAADPAPPAAGTAFDDPGGSPQACYEVLAVDRDGRASAWPDLPP